MQSLSSNKYNIAVLSREHDAVVHLKRANDLYELSLGLDDRLSTLEGLLVWHLHDLLPENVDTHCLVGVFVLLHELENEPLLFQASFSLDLRCLEELADLLLVVDLETLARMNALIFFLGC